MNPVVLLDVDGVVAPTTEQVRYDSAPIWAELPPGRMHVPSHIVERLRSWHDTGLVSIEWCTTWHEEAPNDLAPALELPPWSFHPREHASGGQWWKQAIVRRYLEAGSRIAWLDDDIDYRADLFILSAPADQLLTICPDPTVGLTTAHLDAVEQWATGLA